MIFFLLLVFHNWASLTSFIQMSLFMLSFHLQAVAYQIQNYEARLPFTPLPSDSLPVFYLKGRTSIRNTVECVPTVFPTLQENKREWRHKGSYGMATRGGCSCYLFTCSSPWWCKTYFSSLGATQSIVLCVNWHKLPHLSKTIRNWWGNHSPHRETEDAFIPQAAKSTEDCWKDVQTTAQRQMNSGEENAFLPAAAYSEHFSVTWWHWEVLIQLILHSSFNTTITSAFLPQFLHLAINTYLGYLEWYKHPLFSTISHIESHVDRTGQGIPHC